MRHLTVDELVDLGEGSARDADVPHLAACAECRHRLADLRATMAMASEVEVPEPSPLFWDHFSSRVRDAVAAERAGGEAWWQRFVSWPGLLAPVSAAAAAILVAAIVFKSPATVPEAQHDAHIASSTPIPASSPAPGVELLSDSLTADDPSLTLVAELSDSLGWDEAADAGLALSGSAEHAVTHLSRDELGELQRLLKEEMGRKGA